MSFNPRLLQLTRSAHVRQLFKRLGVDPVGIELMANKALHLNTLLERVPCAAANILKQEMIALGGDAAVARGTVSCTISYTDVLLMGTRKQLDQLILRLPRQPFGLKGLAQELSQLLNAASSVPRVLVGRSCRLELSRPQVMGIINVTPDSFYDGGVCCDLDTALKQAEAQINAGADLLDVGGESTRPSAAPVAGERELQRVVPLITALNREFDVPLSIDTSKALVATAAVEGGADFINDISGLSFDPQMAQAVAFSGAGLFVMHTRGRPDEMQLDTDYHDVVADVIAGLRSSVNTALSAGIPVEKIAVDPGIGFGKSLDGNLEILRRLSELSCLACPVLIGTSRKSFIGHVLKQHSPSERLYGSVASVALAVASGAHLFRVHDVAATRDAVDMAWAICQSESMA